MPLGIAPGRYGRAGRAARGRSGRAVVAAGHPGDEACALGRLGRAMARRGRLVIAVWLLLAAASAALLPGLASRLAPPSMEVPGSESARAAAAIARGFPELGAEQMLLAFDSARLDSSAPPYQRALDATVRTLDARPDIGALLPLPAVERQHPHHVYVLAGVHGDELTRQGRLPGQLATAQQAAYRASAGQVTVTIIGLSRAFAQLAHTDMGDLRSMELRVVPLAVLLLVLGLGAVGAAAVPLLVGGAAILTGTGALTLAGALWHVDSTMLTFTVTVSLGLGLDYALLVLLRYRQARRAGRPPLDGAGHAVATAGSTVCWCALAIMITSGGLLLVGVPWAHSMALAGLLAAFVTMLAALTLTPALLLRLDARLEWGTLPWLRAGGMLPWLRAGGMPFWRRAAGLAARAAQPARPARLPVSVRGAGHLMRHPVRYALAATALLLVAALPVLDMRLGLHYDRDTLAGTDIGGALARLEADRVASLTSVALPHPAGGGPVDTSALTAALRNDDRVTLVSALDNGRDLTLVLIADRAAPDGAESAAFLRDVHALAARLLPAGQQVLAVGPAARLGDLSAGVLSGLWRVLGLVLLSSFVLLLITFRSLLIPLKAVVMNVLCLCATFGLLTLWFQHVRPVAADVNVLLPLIIFTIVFGLSLDYEVFLVHRIAEHYRQTGDNTAAVLHGLRHTARPITLAAAVMAMTFAGLMFTRRLDFQQAGFAVAVAIVIDATLIRMVLVPALMRLLGQRNWWLPRPLSRLLPPR
ncbi:MMPL family transporter [Nonomuraea rosea]|uniref:MMPL family transporter n=1 Tax=Nonomuraea rosea TaxID=638574 RepID=A0ABP6Y8T9_9ACTN